MPQKVSQCFGFSIAYYVSASLTKLVKHLPMAPNVR